MATNTKKQSLDFKALSPAARKVVEALAKGWYTKVGVAELIEDTEAKAESMIKSLAKAGWLRKYGGKGGFATSAKAEAVLESLRSGGQAGKPLDLGYDDLTPRERKVVDALTGGGTLSISELVEACGWSNPKVGDGQLEGAALGNSRVRNQLRRLVRSSWVENAQERGKGTYRLSRQAKKRLTDVAKAPKAAAKAPKRTKPAVKKTAPKAPKAAEAAEF